MNDSTASTTAARFHCSWSSCSRLYTKTAPGYTYCGDTDCPGSRMSPEHAQPTTEPTPPAPTTDEPGGRFTVRFGDAVCAQTFKRLSDAARFASNLIHSNAGVVIATIWDEDELAVTVMFEIPIDLAPAAEPAADVTPDAAVEPAPEPISFERHTLAAEYRLRAARIASTARRHPLLRRAIRREVARLVYFADYLSRPLGADAPAPFTRRAA